MPFSPKNVHTFFVCFSFFPFKKTKKVYIPRVKTRVVYILFCFFKWKKGKTNKKSMYIFWWKRLIIIVPFFLELYFFSGIIFFFRGYIFFVPGFVFFFFPRFESFGANNFWIYQLFSGHFPNLKNPQLAAQHQQLCTYIVSNKRNYIFGSTQTWENTASKIIVPEKKELYTFGSVPNVQKKTASKIIVPEKKEL